jgi:hypothetical protein
MSINSDTAIEVERKVRDKCGDRCAVCGQGADVQVVPLGRQPPSESDLICLCGLCRDKAAGGAYSEEQLDEALKSPWVERIESELSAMTSDSSTKVEVVVAIDCDDATIGDVEEFVKTAIAGFCWQRNFGPTEIGKGHHNDEHQTRDRRSDRPANRHEAAS